MRSILSLILCITINSSALTQQIVNIDTKLKSVDRIKFISDETYKLAYFGNDEFSELIVFNGHQPTDTLEYSFYSQADNKKSILVDFNQDEDYFYIYILETQIFGNDIKVVLLKYSKKNNQFQEKTIGTYEGPLNIISKFKESNAIQMIQLDKKGSSIIVDQFVDESFIRTSINFNKKLNTKYLEQNNFKYMPRDHSFLNGYDTEQAFSYENGYIFLIANTSESKEKILYYELNMQKKSLVLTESNFQCKDCAITFRDNEFFSIELEKKNFVFTSYDITLQPKLNLIYSLESINFLNNPVFEDGDHRLGWPNKEQNTKSTFKFLRKGIVLFEIYDLNEMKLGVTIGGIYFPKNYYSDGAGTTGFVTSQNPVQYSTTAYLNKTDFTFENSPQGSDLIEQAGALLQGYLRKDYDYKIDENKCEILLLDKKELKFITFDR
jgi:hypothetical protein